MLGTQSWLNLFDSMDCNVPGSSVHGIVQARILEGRHKSWRIKVQQEVHACLSQSRFSYLKLKTLQMHSWERCCLDSQSTTGCKFRLDQEELGRERRQGGGGGWNCVWGRILKLSA